MTSLPGLQKLSSASCDLDLWPPNPQNWSFHAPVRRITCVNWHQRQFIHFQNITFTSLVTDKRTDRCRMNEQIENIMPLSASLAWQRHKNKQIITVLPDWFLCFVKILQDSFNIFINFHLSTVNCKRTPSKQYQNIIYCHWQTSYMLTALWQLNKEFVCSIISKKMATNIFSQIVLLTSMMLPKNMTLRNIF